MIVVLFPVSGDEPNLQPAMLEELARLGVTSVAVLRDDSTAGLVLEGWAFDPRDGLRAARAVAGARGGLRTLQPLAHMAVSPAADPAVGPTALAPTPKNSTKRARRTEPRRRDRRLT